MLAVAVVWLAGGTARAADEPCPPLPADELGGESASSRVCSGVTPAEGEHPSGDTTRGRIVDLPAGGGVRRVDAMPGEALLVLPKGPDGRVDTDFVLAPGARILGSYWSPVLCATVVRIAGPAGAAPGDLVVKRPKGSRLSPNKRYVTSTTTLRPLVVADAQGAPSPAAAPTPHGVDPYLRFQYGLHRTGVLEGRPAFDGAGVRVAVLDSTPEVAHRELERVRIVPLAGEEKGPAALHGTLVTGVIAATENNGFGIAGVASGAEIVAIPVCAPAGDGAGDECRLDALLQGLDVAWKEDARVANLSLVGPPDALLERAVARMHELGILLVAAAGNEGSTDPRYPAAYPTVLGVGALDASDRPWPRSNHGRWVRLLAPGVEVLSTAPGDAFAFGDGTSLAAAHVSGMLAIALMATDRPDDAERALLAAARSSDPATASSKAQPPSAPIPRLCDVMPLLGQHCGARP